MTYITYHEWCKHLRDAALMERSAGRLQRVAAQAGIPLDRLERWLQETVNLSHAEFISLHEVLSETYVLRSEDVTATAAERKDVATDAMQPQQCGCSICEDNDISFDESD